MSPFQFKKGTKVEISIDEDGFRGAWFPGTVFKPPTKNGKKLTVEYETLLADDGHSPLQESVDLVQLRPTPPREISRVFKLDEEVDVFHNDGWWEGVITQVLDGGRYSVYFRPTRDQTEFDGADLRLHREWVSGKWVPSLELEIATIAGLYENHQEPQPTEEKIQKETEEKTFSKGSLVEVSSDEEGFEGAWFAATVVEVLGKDKFLVEYQDLKTEDDTEFVREEIDSLHIRPCPPKVVVDKFKQYEEVDALYNDGWWVGVIFKVLSRAKYQVFFKSTDEKMEFKRDELRLHQDWTNGKWVVASKALDLSDGSGWSA